MRVDFVTGTRLHRIETPRYISAIFEFSVFCHCVEVYTRWVSTRLTPQLCLWFLGQ